MLVRNVSSANPVHFYSSRPCTGTNHHEHVNTFAGDGNRRDVCSHDVE